MDYKNWPIRTLNFTETYGMKNLTADAIHELRMMFEGNRNLTLKYLALKLGYDPNVPEEFMQAMQVYV